MDSSDDLLKKLTRQIMNTINTYIKVETMKYSNLEINDVFLLEPIKHSDERGYFMNPITKDI